MSYNPKTPAVVGHFRVDAARTEFIRLRMEHRKLLSPEEDSTITEEEMKIIRSIDEKTLVEQVESLQEKVAAQKRLLRHCEEESPAQPATCEAAMTSAESSTSASTEDPAIEAIMNSFSCMQVIVSPYGKADQPSTSSGPPLPPEPQNASAVPVIGAHFVGGRMEIVKYSDVTSEPHDYTVLATTVDLPPQFDTFPSPWYFPLAYGWNRYLDKNGDVVYKSPYEKELRTMREVATYLQTYKAPFCYSAHHLFVGQFTFSKLCDPRRAIPVDLTRPESFADFSRRFQDLAHPESFVDFSQGRVRPPVIIRKSPDNQPLPMMKYATQPKFSVGVLSALGVAAAKELQGLVGCDCTDGCLDETKCACRQKTMKRLTECPKPMRPKNAVCEYGTLTERIPTGIYACNQKCACWNKPIDPENIQPGRPVFVWPTCSNLVVHNGSEIPMEMYRSKEMGWAVRTLADIPKGAFVVKYVGEVITDAEANRLEDSTYFANLNFPLLGRKKPFVVDGKFYGNVAAFINHSCEPNLFGQHVFTYSHHHDRLPEIVLFAGRDIKAGEDLSWDYGYENQQRVPCKCGSQKCRGWLM